MSKITNNERILNLLETHHQFEIAMQGYLKQLKQDYLWQNDTRRNYGILKSQLIQVRRQIQSAMSENNRTVREVKGLIRHIKRVARQLETTIADEYHQTSPLLNQIAGARKITAVQAEACISRLHRTAGVELMDGLLSLLKNRAEIADVDTPELSLRGLQQMALRVSENDLTSLREFRQSIATDELKLKLRAINDGLQTLGVTAEPINERLVELPIPAVVSTPTELEQILHKGRAPAYYISRGHTVLPYVNSVYSAMNYMRRALREHRKYRGTVNALQRYTDAINALNEYYLSHYTQNNARPRNYHGHYANEHD